MKPRRIEENQSGGGSARRRFAPVLLSIAFLLFSATGFASVPIGDYSRRLEQAAKLAGELTEGEPPASVVIGKLAGIKQLLPASEEVETNGAIVRVDNAWLHETADQVIKNANGDVEQRHSMLTEIELRLTGLSEQVRQSAASVASGPASGASEARARLDGILARADYQPEEVRESSLRRWARRLQEALARFLRRIFGGSSQRESSATSGGTVVLFRVVVLLATAAALVYGLFKLARLRRKRGKIEEESEVREVLGEQIADDATAADLMAGASELAQKGEFRPAIRRAYIALLIEMEQRGKLRLHRSKTNRDYLNALRAEQRVFPKFSSMTGTFEHVWYGQEQANQDKFNDFVAQYRDATKE